MQTLNRLIGIAVLGLLSLGITAAKAQEKKDKVDPTGTWTWSVTGQGGNSFSQTLKLKLDGDKLTGTVLGRGGQETAIEEAKLTGNEVSFQVTRERNGNKITSKYKGTVSGDAIKGKIETPGRDGGEARTRDWEAKKEAK